jgi:hypothetical protein
VTDAREAGNSGGNLRPAIHSFVIKMWQEEGEPQKKPTRWRGYITHVQDKERVYIRSLADITDFIERYFPAPKWSGGFCWRLRQWIKKQKRP